MRQIGKGPAQPREFRVTNESNDSASSVPVSRSTVVDLGARRQRASGSERVSVSPPDASPSLCRVGDSTCPCVGGERQAVGREQTQIDGDGEDSGRSFEGTVVEPTSMKKSVIEWLSRCILRLLPPTKETQKRSDDLEYAARRVIENHKNLEAEQKRASLIIDKLDEVLRYTGIHEHRHHDRRSLQTWRAVNRRHGSDRRRSRT